MRKFQVAATVFATFLLGMQNASATSTGVIVFSGKMVVSTPMCTSAKAVNGCPNNPTDALLFGKAPRTFALVVPNPNSNLFCVGTAANVNKAGKAPAQTDTGCSMLIGGTILGQPGAPAGPWCGRAEGIGITGTVVLAGNTISISNGIFQWAGPELIAAGNAAKAGQIGFWLLKAKIVPDALKGDSCLTGANDFVVTGKLKFTIF